MRPLRHIPANSVCRICGQLIDYGPTRSIDQRLDVIYVYRGSRAAKPDRHTFYHRACVDAQSAKKEMQS